MSLEPLPDDLMRQMIALTRENNRMLKAMRRNAFLGSIIKFVVYALFIIIPGYLYIQYLAPTLNKVMQQAQQISNTGAQAQAQISGWQQTLKDLQAKIPGFTSTTTHK